MENIDTGLTVPKWVLIVRPKIPQMPHNLSAQFVCPRPKVLDFNEKRLQWASVVRGLLFYASLPFAIHYIIHYIPTDLVRQYIVPMIKILYATKLFQFMCHVRWQ